MNKKITLFARINWLNYGTKTVTIDDVISIIQEGTMHIDDSSRSGMQGTLKEVTEQIQALPEGADVQTAKAQFLPAVSFNGVYDGTTISEYSNFTALDFDHVTADLDVYAKLLKKLMATPCVHFVYKTPSGKGLKAVIAHDNNDPKMHGNLYAQLMKMFNAPYLTSDPKCKDLCRRNYLCYDPLILVNSIYDPFHFVYDPSLEPTTKVLSRQCSGSTTITHLPQQPVIAKGLPSDATVMSILKYRCRKNHPLYLCEGYRRDGVFWFGIQVARAGVKFDYGLDYVNTLYHSSDIITLTTGCEITEKEIRENFLNGFTKETYDESFRRSFKSLWSD